MTERDSGAGQTRVVYTCWPSGVVGTTLCGWLLLVGGGAILAESFFPSSSQAVWGIALLALGVWVLSRSRREEER